MQFGGKAIESQNSKIFNCSVRHIDSIRAFSECVHLLLNGVGVGIGLTKHYLNRLPDLVDANDKTGMVVSYTVSDDIRGWADSIEVLLMSYFKNTAFTGRKIVFDYSRIRPEGSPLKTSGGKAPGFRGLKKAHQKIKILLDEVIEEKKQNKIHAIDAYDILMHCADAVLSGGVRRSATITIFDNDDHEMMTAKTNMVVNRRSKHFSLNERNNKYEGFIYINGKKFDVELDKWELDLLESNNTINWWHIHPQRARSNNTVILDRATTSKEVFNNIIEHTTQWGEPDFLFADTINKQDILTNPCQPGFATVLTPDGIRYFDEISIGSTIWSGTTWTKILNKVYTGEKQVYEYATTAGTFLGTENHKVLTEGIKIEIKDTDSIDISRGGLTTSPYVSDLNPQDIMDGLTDGHT
jgi:ribonucleoside-diphosphate reductase alpha chain